MFSATVDVNLIENFAWMSTPYVTNLFFGFTRHISRLCKCVYRGQLVMEETRLGGYQGHTVLLAGLGHNGVVLGA